MPRGCLRNPVRSLASLVHPFGARMIQLWHYKRPLMLGLANPEDYKKDPASLGAICGRYGNRIAGGMLSRDGRHWQLDQNEGEQCLHGGHQGFGVQAWQVAEHASDRLVLMIDSPDLDMGFPGRCQARVSFQLSPDAVNVQISAAVDQACPLNLIQHNYWNLGCDAANHRLVLMADQYWENNERNLPESLNDVSDETDFRAANPFAPAKSTEPIKFRDPVCACMPNSWVLTGSWLFIQISPVFNFIVRLTCTQLDRLWEPCIMQARPFV